LEETQRELEKQGEFWKKFKGNWEGKETFQENEDAGSKRKGGILF
jgi:hypothetical protein